MHFSFSLTYSHFLTLSLTLSLTLYLSSSLSLSLDLFLSLSFSLLHPHALSAHVRLFIHTHSLSLSHTQTHMPQHTRIFIKRKKVRFFFKFQNGLCFGRPLQTQDGRQSAFARPHLQRGPGNDRAPRMILLIDKAIVFYIHNSIKT